MIDHSDSRPYLNGPTFERLMPWLPVWADARPLAVEAYGSRLVVGKAHSHVFRTFFVCGRNGAVRRGEVGIFASGNLLGFFRSVAEGGKWGGGMGRGGYSGD